MEAKCKNNPIEMTMFIYHKITIKIVTGRVLKNVVFLETKKYGSLAQNNKKKNNIPTTWSRKDFDFLY